MRIMVTGNKGYIGEVLTEMLNTRGYEVIGYDSIFYDGFFNHTNSSVSHQIQKDIRHVNEKDLEGVDSIIHLAALSNDPLGDFKKTLTFDINYRATIQLANLAKKAGVLRFVYSSSQSMYGISDFEGELDEDNSLKNPLTEYARTKWLAECELKNLCSSDFIVTFFRPSTVFGFSPKLRCDIVYNNLVSSAYTTGKIEIKSDGTPWRPVVHVRDVCKAFIAGIEAPSKLISNQAFNVGVKDGNYTVRDLAEAAQKVVPGSELTFTGEHGSDSRTYKVSFNKILTKLKDYYRPSWDLIRGGEELIENFRMYKFTEEYFRGRLCNRLSQLKYLLKNNQLTDNFFKND